MQDSQEQLFPDKGHILYALDNLEEIERAIKSLQKQSGDPHGLGYTEAAKLLSIPWLNFVEHAPDMLSRDADESSRIVALIQKMLAGNLSDEEIRELISLKMRFEEIYKNRG